MGKAPGFMVYYDRVSFLDRLTDAQCGQLFRAMMDYAKDGVEPFWDEIALEVAWDVVQPMLDEDARRYQEIVEQNRANAIKRWQKNKDFRNYDCGENESL